MVSPKASGRRAVFFDRDGVLNRALVVDGKPFSPRKLNDFAFMPDALDAVSRIANAGYFIAVATNQPDIGDGLVAAAEVDAMHAYLRKQLPVNAIYCCPHKREVGCNCRKPRPGMLLEAQIEHQLDMARSWMIGDRAGDVAAGQAAGCRTIFINRHYKEAPPAKADAIVDTLTEAVELILVNGESL